ncbi:MAG: hypothetical protein EA423_12575 [Phycisphaerales bacterium]|nr:MAG: hypothetical protein EA423_12575 [Phycisphaerales bacterium]
MRLFTKKKHDPNDGLLVRKAGRVFADIEHRRRVYAEGAEVMERLTGKQTPMADPEIRDSVYIWALVCTRLIFHAEREESVEERTRHLPERTMDAARGVAILVVAELIAERFGFEPRRFAGAAIGMASFMGYEHASLEEQNRVSRDRMSLDYRRLHTMLVANQSASQTLGEIRAKAAGYFSGSSQRLDELGSLVAGLAESFEDAVGSLHRET